MFLCWISNSVNGQSIEILYGRDIQYSNVITGVPNTKGAYQNSIFNGIIKANLTIPIGKKDGSSLRFGYHQNSSTAIMQIGTEDETEKGEGVRAGTSNTTYYRLGIGYQYKIFLYKNSISFRPSILANVEYADQTWANGPRQQFKNGRYQTVTYSESTPGFQVLPEIQGTFGFKIFAGLHFYFHYSYFYGFKPTQSIRAELIVDGVPQEDALNINFGRSHHAMIGLGYEF